jgi:large conductance mechanosensitive channel
MVKEFKEFIMRGNVMDMAVGIIIGVAFGTVVNSLVADVIMPPVGLLLGKVDFANLFAVLKQGATAGPYASLAAAKAAGAVTLNFGQFVNTIINFVILAFVIFLMVKGVNKLRRPKSVPAGEPTTKDCPFCYSSIPVKATRCPNCTSELSA